jgi:hypothetical protein
LVKNREAEIWSAWQKLRSIFPSMHEQHIIFPNCSFSYIFTALPMTGISSEHLFCSRCWEGDRGPVTGATQLGLKFFKQGFLPNKACFLVSHLLNQSYVVLVDVKTEQVKTRAASNLVAIFLLP